MESVARFFNILFFIPRISIRLIWTYKPNKLFNVLCHEYEQTCKLIAFSLFCNDALERIDNDKNHNSNPSVLIYIIRNRFSQHFRCISFIFFPIPLFIVFLCCCFLLSCTRLLIRSYVSRHCQSHRATLPVTDAKELSDCHCAHVSLLHHNNGSVNATSVVTDLSNLTNIDEYSRRNGKKRYTLNYLFVFSTV